MSPELQSVVKQFLYDGDELVAEYTTAAPTTIYKRYVHGPADDDPWFWYQGATLGTRMSMQSDHQGSIVSVADASGNMIAINKYDEYGIPGSTNAGRFQYTGQAWMPEIGMYYYKARIYSPTLGRFMQTDPVGYKDQINLYAYVGNDPIGRSDPTGKEIIYNGTESQNKAMKTAFEEMAAIDKEWATKFSEMSKSDKVLIINFVQGDAVIGVGTQPRTREAVDNASNGKGSSVNAYINLGGTTVKGVGPGGSDLREDVKDQASHDIFDHAYKIMNGTLNTDADLGMIESMGTADMGEIEAVATENRWRSQNHEPRRERYSPKSPK